MKAIFLCVFLSLSAFGADLTGEYERLYGSELSSAELAKLAETEIVLIPGIGSETFVWEDTRGSLDLSLLFKNSFGAQLDHYRHLGIPVRRLWASSYSVQETIDEITATVEELRAKKKKALFITHSLGGLALLDFLTSEQDLRNIQGILFLQSPFYGSPMATVYFENPYLARTILGPLLRYVNTSEDSVEYLSLEFRRNHMKPREKKLGRIFARIPALTLGTTTLGHRSLMASTANVIAYGCLVHSFGACRSKKIFPGPYSNSDGMVPLESSRLPGVDHIVVDGVDHGETLQAMPFKSVNRVQLTDAALRVLLNLK